MLPGLCTTQSKPKCISASLIVGLLEFLLVSVFYGQCGVAFMNHNFTFLVYSQTKIKQPISPNTIVLLSL